MERICKEDLINIPEKIMREFNLKENYNKNILRRFIIQLTIKDCKKILNDIVQGHDPFKIIDELLDVNDPEMTLESTNLGDLEIIKSIIKYLKVESRSRDLFISAKSFMNLKGLTLTDQGKFLKGLTIRRLRTYRDIYDELNMSELVN